MTVDLKRTLSEVATRLRPQREALVEAWCSAVEGVASAASSDIRAFCLSSTESLLERLSRGEVESFLENEKEMAIAIAQGGASLHPLAAAIGPLARCWLPFLASAFGHNEELLQGVLALEELGHLRQEMLLLAQEDEGSRRLAEAQNRVSVARETAREATRAAEDLRRARAQSQHRAEQIGLLNVVAHKLSGILEADRLMQVAAETIQGRMRYPYVAIVTLDAKGRLEGRWSGRPGMERQRSRRPERPPGGIIGRALRKRAPQVVEDVGADPDYLVDVPGIASEMVIPLLEGSEVVGAIDFQSETRAAFDLDDVAAGEILADFLVVALRNARLFREARGNKPPGGPASDAGK